MLNLAKRLAKVFKGIVRPKSTKVQVVELPAREDLTARLIQALQSEIDAKLKAFLDAVEDYPYVYDNDADEFPYSEGSNLINALERLGFKVDVPFARDCYMYSALCAAIEYHQQNDNEITVELVADVVEAINDNEYVFFPGVEDDEDLGSAILDEFQEDRQSWGYGWLIRAVDRAELGNQWRNDEGGCYTSRGYFQFGELEF